MLARTQVQVHPFDDFVIGHHPDTFFPMEQRSPPTANVLAALPSEVCFQICRHIDWKDLVALENVSKPMKQLLDLEPLLWAVQVTKAFSCQAMPKSLIKWLATPLSPPLPWRDIFMSLRQIKPSACFIRMSPPGQEELIDRPLPTAAVEGSDFGKVLTIKKRNFFSVQYGTLPPGTYVVLCRMKVAKGCETYVSFSSHFSRSSGGNELVTVDQAVSSPGSSTSDSSNGPDVPVLPTESYTELHHLPEYLAGCPPSPAESSSKKEARNKAETGGLALLQKWPKMLTPSLQFLLGSWSATWQQLQQEGGEEQGGDRWLASAAEMAKMLTPSLQFLSARGPPTWQQVGRGPSQSRAALSRLSSQIFRQASTQIAAAQEHKTVDQETGVCSELLKGSKQPSKRSPPDQYGWQAVPVGHVTIRSACRSTRLAFVVLVGGSATEPAEVDPNQGNVCMDFICLRPDNSTSRPLAWLSKMTRRG
eukprot:gene12490-15702_t